MIALFWVVVYIAFTLAAPAIKFRPTTESIFMAVVFISVIAFMLIGLSVVRALSALPRNWKADLLVFVLFTLLFLLSLKLPQPSSVLEQLTLTARSVKLCRELTLILAAIFLGRLISNIVREPNMLVPAACAAALVDVWAVNLGGTTFKALEKIPDVVKKVTVAVPQLGGEHLGVPVIALMGAGDIFFTAMFFTLLFSFQFDTKISFWCTASLFVLGMILVLALPFPLPGLPFLAIGILLPNWKRFHFSRSERLAMIVVGLILIANLIIAMAAIRRL